MFGGGVASQDHRRVAPHHAMTIQAGSECEQRERDITSASVKRVQPKQCVRRVTAALSRIAL
jgi:hypothetical protein